MTYLLDTHTLLWVLFQPEKLSYRVATTILNRRNRIFISSISLWEISLKFSLKKLELNGITPEQLPRKIRESGFEFINDSPEVFANYFKLPVVKHSDPFDRFLIWQALNFGLVFLTKDRYLENYDAHGLQMLW
ncbi:type II toxin-antitoxin system VapC family toxin [Leptospira sarikeiensis]|uniref:Type II toxin-antitoxin system VapC family toxin n=1 Tax=Leptospira sarikeiensis TaxID=2484943 RepID=A0A4R9KEU4_9LEPT|nr:type II toxin-antitoxin system VapC family toxin [Leptospira sarikeiensis]TGL65783.1 type II toxin-antitoxin system VapC family toxin [Leptospira sarikeiensis]